MKFISTRGASPPASFIEALLGGLAPDGGLYSPEVWPRFTPDEIVEFAGKPYAEVAAHILGLFAQDDMSPRDMLSACQGAYASFHHPAVTPLRQLTPGAYLLELFHGPSLAFKDVAMQLLARLYEHVLMATGRTLTVVCATSGDTGGAAVEAFAGRANIRIVVLFPEGRISEVQRRFMTTTDEANVRAVAVAGDFDDCQAILKAMFRDGAFAKEVSLTAVNSINFVRIAAQSVYYFVAAAALGAPHRSVSFAVPTGNFGDAFAGWAAHRMGLPIERILAATNSNDILARALETGVYERRTLVPTQSPAMDIQVASNFERLYFEAAGRDGAAVRRAFEGFDQSGTLNLPEPVWRDIRERFVGVSIDESETVAAMTGAWTAGLGALDPHTAVALAGAEKLQPRASAPLVVLSTAHAAKFPQAVEAATGVSAAPPAVVTRLAAREERFDRLPADPAAVKAYVRAFVTV
jgi:threonine synthase